MKLDLAVVGLVLVAALLHASWNAIVKSAGDRLISFAVVQSTGTLMAVVALPFVAVPRAEAWPFILASVLIHNGYYYFLLRAYAHGDLSLVYPIARGLGPLLVAVFSGRLAGEYLAAGEAAGVALVSLGVASLALGSGWPRGVAWRPIVYAVATGVFIAGYTLVDGLGVRAAQDALAYIVWLNLLESPAVVAAVLWRRGLRVVGRLHVELWRSVTGGAIGAVGYGIAIWAMSVGGLAHVAALRETSVLFAAVMGTVLLREGFGAKRIAAAALVVAGLLMMNLPLLRF